MKPDKLTDEPDKLTGFFSFIFARIVLVNFEEPLMHEISEDQIFLIISEINLFPELNTTNSIKMVEQIMNALLITSEENIQEGINRVVSLENFCKDSLVKNEDSKTLLEKLKPMLANYNMFTAQGDEVKLMYPRYYDKKKYFWDVGKQSAINLEFSLEKKLSYDGKQIILEDTYIDWVYQLLTTQRISSRYNSEDRLLYYIIEPQTTLKHVQIRQIIERETYEYVKEFRSLIQQDQKDKYES